MAGTHMKSLQLQEVSVAGGEMLGDVDKQVKVSDVLEKQVHHLGQEGDEVHHSGDVNEHRHLWEAIDENKQIWEAVDNQRKLKTLEEKRKKQHEMRQKKKKMVLEAKRKELKKRRMKPAEIQELKMMKGRGSPSATYLCQRVTSSPFVRLPLTRSPRLKMLGSSHGVIPEVAALTRDERSTSDKMAKPSTRSPSMSSSPSPTSSPVGSPSKTTRGRKTRRLTSKVWKGFKPIYHRAKLVKAQCNHRDEILPAGRVVGTSDVRRHLDTCKISRFCSMEDLPEALVTEIVKKITRTTDLNSLSLVSKKLCNIEGNQRGAIHVGSGLCTATEALTSLCARFPNLLKVEIDYSGWMPGHGNQLDNKGLFVFSSHCSSLIDLTLSFCSKIDDSGLGYLAYCKKLVSLRLNTAPQITSIGLLSVAVGCTSLSALHLIDCEKIDSVEWLEYLGRDGSLEELVVKNCKGINHHDLLKFGSGWIKLQKFQFERKRGIYDIIPCEDVFDSLYDAHSTDIYDFCCESLKDLRLARIKTWPELGLRVLLGKCKALENLSLEHVLALNDNDIIALSRSCSNLKSISLWLNLQHYSSDVSYCETRTSFTDNSFNALALNCHMLQIVDLKFTACSRGWPSEIGFTQEGFVVLIQSCPIRVLVLNTANFFDDDGMKALSASPYLETLELIMCHAVTDAGMRFIARTPCLSNLTLRVCHNVTDVGVAELRRAHKLESLVIEFCNNVSLQAAQGVAKSVHYSKEGSTALRRKIGLYDDEF